MEKSEQQINFVKQFKPFIDSIELNDDFDNFIEKFKNHEYFNYSRTTIEELEQRYGKDGVKIFIFCSFTRDRETCKTLVQLLKDSNLTEQAKNLEESNKSSGPWKLTKEIEIKVAKRPAPIKDLSSSITLSKKKRGLCIIINNVEDPQWPPYDDHGVPVNPIGLRRETERFRNIFTQLSFGVESHPRLTAECIKQLLEKISKDSNRKNDEAFVLIVLSHGENEKVLGFNACEASRKIRFDEIDRSDLEAKQEIQKDQVSIKDLVDILSDKASVLESKPKLHFYICCRVKIENDNNGTKNTPEVVFTKKKPVPKIYNNTYVSYACAEGARTYFDDNSGISDFGQALTHSIAQYACDNPFGEVMTRTSQRLKQMYDDCEHYSGIQVINYDTSFQLYFNPGHCDEQHN